MFIKQYKSYILYKMANEITKEIKEVLKRFFWIDEEGKTKVSLGNCRLDFKKDYYFEKFTKKGVKLYWVNGDERVYVIGKIKWNAEYNDFAFYTEKWQYIEHFKLENKKHDATV